MGESMQPQVENELSWYVSPETPTALASGLARIHFIAVMTAVVCYLVLPPAQKWPAVCIVLGIAYVVWVWQSKKQSHEKTPNIWLKSSGLVWLSSQQQSLGIPRELMIGYYLGSDVDALDSEPKLVLLLQHGFLSQPLCLRQAASPEEIHNWIHTHWQLTQYKELPAEKEANIELTCLIEEQNQVWKFLGAKQGFEHLLLVMQELAAIAPPCSGVRPKRLILELAEIEYALAIADFDWVEFGELTLTYASWQALLNTLQLTVLENKNYCSMHIGSVRGNQWKLEFLFTDADAA
jgi:hypothetical protein